MSGELTLLVIRLVFLAIMWIFVFSIVYALRSDLFGSRSRDYQQAMAQSRQQTFAGSGESNAAAAARPQPTQPAPQSAPAASSPPPSQGGQAQSSNQGQPDRLSKLVITSGPKRGFEIELGREPLSIGRARDADVCIQDDYTSTRHARLLNWDGAWMLQDLDSTNGTFINGERVSQPVELRSGVSVRIGTTTFELR
ncbi:FHA domain-containing protein FhaB/FipA [Gulosibacter chungangensis]|uniref:FHA domain-containing protein n=1 Tax=Gulosibacter chungangensis TaxID=979746 RepID=A0A7J5BGA2_9MICO|nr:FHA domain-containing protein [Gulosibacter chungangensis]KAB1645285.1 FHA domain-containing protein [Gulosibacter chungangensis]